jgi:cytoskeletal protein CcmA (bactofilin family)
MWNPESGQSSTTSAQSQTPGTPRAVPDLRSTRSAASAAAIGSSVFVKGDLTAQEDLTVDGRVEGRIDLPGHTLTIGPNAKVNATIAAKVLTVFGTIAGTIAVQERLDIRNGAMIEGDVTCARISIQEGAVVAGKVTMPRRTSKSNGEATNVPIVAAR